MNVFISRGQLAACLAIKLSLLGACSDDADKESDPSNAVAQPDGGGEPSLVAQDGRPHVTIDDGELAGVIEGGTNKFLGIPFAKPPVAALRFKRPQRNEKWSGVRDASTFGKRCAQVASATLQNAGSEDEDCLYLNVWTPDLKPAAPLPVMFWIHGGGNVNGSASEPVPFANTGVFYSGQSLAQKGVVVVSINYRLGVFGFLAHSDLAKEGEAGNQGLYDQVAALEWVKRNIAKFGGDASKVTIFGESAGSLDVCVHMVSPKSRGLFVAAISQSGGCTTRNATLSEGQANASQLATQLSCSSDALTCLRDKPVADLLRPVMSAAGAPLSFGPVVDADLLPDQARTLFDTGNVAKVPYMLGSNTDEGTLFVPPTTKLDSQEELIALVTTTFPGADVQAILAAYPIASFMEPPNRIALPMHASWATRVWSAARSIRRYVR